MNEKETSKDEISSRQGAVLFSPTAGVKPKMCKVVVEVSTTDVESLPIEHT
jgi:hypothetical protein